MDPSSMKDFSTSDYQVYTFIKYFFLKLIIWRLWSTYDLISVTSNTRKNRGSCRRCQVKIEILAIFGHCPIFLEKTVGVIAKRFSLA